MTDVSSCGAKDGDSGGSFTKRKGSVADFHSTAKKKTAMLQKSCQIVLMCKNHGNHRGGEVKRVDGGEGEAFVEGTVRGRTWTTERMAVDGIHEMPCGKAGDGRKVLKVPSRLGK